jgi:hypothetical protein
VRFENVVIAHPVSHPLRLASLYNTIMPKTRFSPS